jgi:ribosome-associated toxin RatA of RatAB toxin-antitoxin module
MALDAAQEVSVEIAATVAECFAAILDFERYPQWSSTVTSARILERDKAGVGRVVEFHINMKIRTVRYVLAYAYQKPTELTWHSVDGDVEAIEGRYHFRQLGRGLTEATCRQEIQLGFWVPGPLRKLAERTALRQSVTEFKAAVERQLAQPKAPEGRRSKSKARGGRRET